SSWREGARATCPECGVALGEKTKFCPECGAKILQVVFCKECGTKVGDSS
ncbi:MAG: zinc-ribbon domain-containing protein, partial [Chloroflexi bacterium]|nr:zinc-ribbon domain-containing protein [Chloroflexota bacterium]